MTYPAAAVAQTIVIVNRESSGNGCGTVVTHIMARFTATRRATIKGNRSVFLLVFLGKEVCHVHRTETELPRKDTHTWQEDREPHVPDIITLSQNDRERDHLVLIRQKQTYTFDGCFPL